MPVPLRLPQNYSPVFFNTLLVSLLDLQILSRDLREVGEE